MATPLVLGFERDLRDMNGTYEQTGDFSGEARNLGRFIWGFLKSWDP